MIKTLVTFCLLFASCQKHKEHAPVFVQPLIAQKAELYKSLHKGWAHDKCDSIGFTALCKLAGGCDAADIYQAESTPGRWFRSPEKDCYDLGQSQSDISKDMFVMLLPYLYKTGRKDKIGDIYDYAKANGNVMGRGPLSRVLLTPSLILLIQEMLGHFGISTSKELEVMGFENHLDVISWYTQTLVRGGMDATDYEKLRKYVEREPRNALYQALYHKFKDGNQSAAIDILMDESLFPSDRLPKATDRCEEYLWQRDAGSSDWQPCAKDKVHDGVDFLFAAYIAGQI
jgi:hypothetical protein